LDEEGVSVSKVQIPLSMHIGAPSVPVVKCGDRVAKGQLIAEIPEKSLGARIHASIAGTVTNISNSMIEISAL
jgi:Na+-translocating ferredoxin:NAD+ oxidoreductase RnfC subunit